MVPITQEAVPKTITLLYFVVNFSGTISVSVTTQNDTLELFAILSNLCP